LVSAALSSLSLPLPVAARLPTFWASFGVSDAGETGSRGGGEVFVLEEVVRSTLHGCAAVDSASALDLSLTWEEADLQRERWSDEV
jgi:hypothetical protein